MSQNKSEQFKKLIDSKQLDEAKKFLATFFKSDWTDEEKGDWMAFQALQQLELENEVNKIEIEILKKALPILEKIDKKQKQAEESGKLSDVKKKIQEL